MSKTDRVDQVIDGFRHDVKLGFRALLRAPMFSAVSIVLLGLGIGATVAIFTIIHAVLIQELPYADPDHLLVGRSVNVFHSEPNLGWIAAPDYFDFAEQNRSFASLSTYAQMTFRNTIVDGGEAGRAESAMVSWNLFPTLGVDPILGRHFTAEEGEAGQPGNVFILSHRYWQDRYGGSEDVIGRAVTLNGTVGTIVGVMPADFRFLRTLFPRLPDLWRPMVRNGPFADNRLYTNWIMVGRLGPEVTPDQARTDLTGIADRLAQTYPASNERRGVQLTGLQAFTGEGVRGNLLLLLAAVGLVLLIACSNVAGLLLARGTTRRVELAIQAAMGATRGRLARLLLTENLIVAVIAGGCGLLLAIWFKDLIPRFMPLEMVGITAVSITAPVITFALLLTLATGGLAGLVPALRGSSPDPARHLKAGGRSTDIRTGYRLRSGLVVGQIMISVLLLSGAGVLIRSFSHLMDIDLGFEPENLLTAEVTLPSDSYTNTQQMTTFYTRLLAEIEHLPGVVSAGVVSQLPLRNPGNNMPVVNPDDSPESSVDAPTANFRVASPGYFETMGIPVLAGRGLEASDTGSTAPVIVISANLARTLFGDSEPVGRQVQVGAGQGFGLTVVGIVGDVRMGGVANDPFQAMYLSWLQAPQRTLRLAVRTSGAAVTESVRGVLDKLDRSIPLAEPQSMESIVAENVSDRWIMMILLTLLSVTALVLAMTGLYGTLAYHVRSRIHEIGIRMALGARRGRILRAVLGRGMVLSSIGVALGAAGAYASNRLLQNQLYGVEPYDPVTISAVLLLTLIVTLLACLLPGWRATTVDPVIPLRLE